MTPPTKKDNDKRDDLYGTDASQPEVIYDQDPDYAPDDVPSQAEGDRETIEADLKQKDKSKTSPS